MHERLVSAETPGDPAANLARGLSLIALVQRPDTPSRAWAERDEGVAHARRIWQRLRARWKR